MNRQDFEKTVLARPGATERVAAIEKQLLVSHALSDLRRSLKVSQRELAGRLGVSQPRIAAIECSEDITIGTLARYATALGAHVEVRVTADDQRHFEVLA